MMRFCLFIVVLGLCHDVSKAECTTRGRFPNNVEADCRGYTMCLPTGTTFVLYKLACPIGSVYSHIEQQCTTSPAYQCLSNYTCYEPGNFEDSNANCTSFVSCTMGLNGLVSARRIDCPLTQVFSPGNGCVNSSEYVCPIEIETTTVEMTTELVTTVLDDKPHGHPLSEVPLNSVGRLKTNVFVIWLVCYLIKSI